MNNLQLAIDSEKCQIDKVKRMLKKLEDGYIPEYGTASDDIAYYRWTLAYHEQRLKEFEDQLYPNRKGD